MESYENLVPPETLRRLPSKSVYAPVSLFFLDLLGSSGGAPIPAVRPAAAAAARFFAAGLVRTLEVLIGTMERQHKKPAANTTASSPASSGSSSSSRSIHGSMSSAFLGVSSSTHSQSQRRSSPSLSPPPALAPLPGLLASRGSAATGGSASGSSSFQFHQISPSPETAAKRRPRPGSRVTHSLPSPFLSELSAIRRMGTNLFGDLNAQEMTQRPLLHCQQE